MEVRAFFCYRLLMPRGLPSPSFAVLALALLGTSACTVDSSSIASTVQTSIVVRSNALVGAYGCGTKTGQVFRYAVTVRPPSDSTQPPVGGVWDCYADATFASLAASSSGQPFTLEIFAFDATAYRGAPDAIEQAAAAANTAALAGLATRRTSCTATQQSSVTVLANCGPLH